MQHNVRESAPGRQADKGLDGRLLEIRTRHRDVMHSLFGCRHDRVGGKPTMRLPAPLIAATGSLALALGLAVIPNLVASPSAVQAQDAPTLAVTLDEWSITPSNITIPADQTVRFTLVNAGTTNTQELTIAGFGEELHSEIAAIGE